MAKAPASKLSPKHQRFVAEYLIDLNATQAAIRAGYSERTAKQQGARLLTNADIAAAVDKAGEERTERTKIDADWILKRLAEEADADVGDLFDDEGNLKPMREWPVIWRKGLITGIETSQRQVGKDDDGNPIFQPVHKLKLSDRRGHIELLGKHVYVSAFREKIDHTSSDGSMSPPSLADFYAGLAKPK